MRKYLIEGSCDGSMFAETVEAQSLGDAEACAIERLCEAWGETYGPDTELGDLGDAACVTEYTPEDYIRDAAPELYEALQSAIEALAMCMPSTRHGATCHNAAMLGGRAALAKARGQACS